MPDQPGPKSPFWEPRNIPIQAELTRVFAMTYAHRIFLFDNA